MARSNGSNGGRGARGRFAKGNPGGPGNPIAKRVHELRSAVLRATTPAKVVRVLDSLYQVALTGDVAAIREYLSRALGPPVQADILADIEAIKDLTTNPTAAGFKSVAEMVAAMAATVPAAPRDE